MPQSRQNLPIIQNYHINFKFYIKITDDAIIFDDVSIFPVRIGIFPPDFMANTSQGVHLILKTFLKSLVIYLVEQTISLRFQRGVRQLKRKMCPAVMIESMNLIGVKIVPNSLYRSLVFFLNLEQKILAPNGESYNINTNTRPPDFRRRWIKRSWMDRGWHV